MNHYYNEFCPNAAAWLRELMADKLIPQGIIDERSITEVTPADLAGFVQCHFFCGIAGWPRALQLAGWPTDRPVWTGSAPCQPFSGAGKGLGQQDERHLWPDFMRLIAKCRPERVIGEQVEGAVRHGWLDGIQADLEAEGYTFGSIVLGAHSIGAPHIRQRLFWVADAGSQRTRGRLLRPAQSIGQGKEWPSDQSGRPGNDGRLENPNDGRCCAGDGSESAGQMSKSRNWIAEQRGGTDRVAHSVESSSVIGLADTQCERGCSGEPRLKDAGNVGQSGQIDHGVSPGTNEGLADSDSNGCDQRRTGQSTPGHDGPVGDGWTCGVADAHQGQCGGITNGQGCVIDGQTTGRDQGNSKPEPSGPWSDYIIIPCLDGKSRRAQREIQCLVDGFPRGVVPSGDPSAQEAQNTGEARVMRLKGYGNAINPSLAAQFIMAVDESLSTMKVE